MPWLPAKSTNYCLWLRLERTLSRWGKLLVPLTSGSLVHLLEWPLMSPPTIFLLNYHLYSTGDSEHIRVGCHFLGGEVFLDLIMQALLELGSSVFFICYQSWREPAQP